MKGAYMTKKDLAEIYYLKIEIDTLEEQIQTLRARVEKVTSTVSNMPRGSKTVDYKDILVDTVKLLTERKKEYNKRLFEIESDVAKIDDPFIRAIIRHKYIEQKSWQQVARAVGGYNTADGVRMALYRFLKKCENI